MRPRSRRPGGGPRRTSRETRRFPGRPSAPSAGRRRRAAAPSSNSTSGAASLAARASAKAFETASSVCAAGARVAGAAESADGFVGAGSPPQAASTSIEAHIVAVFMAASGDVGPACYRAGCSGEAPRAGADDGSGGAAASKSRPKPNEVGPFRRVHAAPSFASWRAGPSQRYASLTAGVEEEAERPQVVAKRALGLAGGRRAEGRRLVPSVGRSHLVPTHVVDVVAPPIPEEPDAAEVARARAVVAQAVDVVTRAVDRDADRAVARVSLVLVDRGLDARVVAVVAREVDRGTRSAKCAPAPSEYLPFS